MAESDDVGAVLMQTRFKCQLFGVVGERNEPCFAVGIIAHQNGQLATWGERSGAIINEGCVSFEKCCKGGRPG